MNEAGATGNMVIQLGDRVEGAVAWEIRDEDLHGRRRVYARDKSESVAENFANRFSRPKGTYTAIVRAGLEALGLSGKIHWSQESGCSCGCSPGFLHEGYGPDLHVDFTITVDERAMVQALDEVGRQRLAAIAADPTMPIDEGRVATPAGSPMRKRETGNVRRASAMGDEKLARMNVEMSQWLAGGGRDPEGEAALRSALEARLGVAA